MGSKWQVYSLGDIADIGSSKRIKMADYVSRGVPFFRSKEIIERHKGNAISTELFISEEQFTSIEAKFGAPTTGDILLTSVGTLGIPYQVANDDRFYFKDGNLTWFRNFKDFVNPRYLYFWLTSTVAKRKIDEVTIGSTQQALTIVALKSITIDLPPIVIQNEIVKHIESISQKISINRQINQTLEQMAQTLFKSWFVDFDPVIDNALDAISSGKQVEIPELFETRVERRKAVRESADFKPLPDDVRQLFPSEFEESELGWVPKGWKLESVSDAIQINPRVKLPKGTEAPFVEMKALPTSGYAVEEVSTKAFTGGAKFEQHDVLLARITPCLQNGKTGFVDFLNEGEVGFGSTEFIVMRQTEDVHFGYVACLARNEKFRVHAMQSMVGSSGRQRVQNSCFDSFVITLPTKDVMSIFAKMSESYFSKMRTNKLESDNLEKLRDTLLPKLISGELRLDSPEVEQAKALVE